LLDQLRSTTVARQGDGLQCFWDSRNRWQGG